MRTLRKAVVMMSALSVVLAACGGASTEGSTAASTTAETPGTSLEQECGTGDLQFLPTATANAPISWWQEVADEFESQHDGLTIEVVDAAGPAIPYMQQLMATGGFPDVFLGTTPASFTGGNPIRPVDVTGSIAELDKVEDLTYEGELYYPPGYILPASLVFYNKDLMESVGVTEEPTTFEEFEAVMEALSEAGITPLMIGGDWSLRSAFLEFTLAEVFRQNPNWYADRQAGEAQFTEGPWLEASERFISWQEKGYIHEAALDLDYVSAQQAFLEGRAAMYPMPSFVTGNDALGENFEVGVWRAPTADGTRVLGANYVGFSVGADTESPEAATCFAEYLSLDDGFQTKLMAAEGWYSNLPTPPEFDRPELEQQIESYVANSQLIPGELGWGDNVGPNSYRAELEFAVQAMVAGTMSAAEALADVEAAWDVAD